MIGPRQTTGIRLVFQEQVEADDADARLALGGDDAVVRAHQLGMDIEGLGDGRPGDIGVEDGGFIAAAAGADRQQRRDQRFAHAALAADDADDFFDVAVLVLLGAEALGTAGAIGGTGAAVVVAGFAHFSIISEVFCGEIFSIPVNSALRRMREIDVLQRSVFLLGHAHPAHALFDVRGLIVSAHGGAKRFRARSDGRALVLEKTSPETTAGLRAGAASTGACPHRK